ncbi:MAG: hypothetical protein Q9197_000484 [Variospora fuerteventurae]
MPPHRPSLGLAHAQALMRSSKRARTDHSVASVGSAATTVSPASTGNATVSSTFRNVSACNRSQVKCVGFDPITKREIPRTYVYYLESRVSYLESLLVDNAISFAPGQELDLGANGSPGQLHGQSPADFMGTSSSEHASQRREACSQEQDDERRLNKLVSNVGMVSVQGTSDPRYLGSTSGISFARVVFTSIKTSVSAGSHKGAVRGPAKPTAGTNRSTVRDSLFGLQPKRTIEPAPFPDREVGSRLVALYFEHANPQIPILHRGEFMALFQRAYAGPSRSARETYMLNIVFAIGSGIILEDSHTRRSSNSSLTNTTSHYPRSLDPPDLTATSRQHQPEEYHAAAMVHLDSFLGSMAAPEDSQSFGGGLEELQAVLLLAGFALLRPSAPGLWYISGVATRLGVDLGLHHEDGTDLDESGASNQQRGHGVTQPSPSDLAANVALQSEERGRKEWLRDMRRRLWWCVYSIDRLVSTCVGRPFGITDQVITTNFPSVLNDEDITTSGFTKSSQAFHGPSYKRVSHHYFRLRLLQSEILQVLQYRQAKQAHAGCRNRERYMHTRLSSSFLQPFGSFRAWRQDMDRRLLEWKSCAPQQQDTTVQFPVQFLELNYWQAIIILYRQSLNGPSNQTGQVSPLEHLDASMAMEMIEEAEDEEIYLKVAEAGQRVLMLYRQLHRIHLVNYTYLATVHLFMAGIAFLYVLWHSHTVRSRLTLDTVDFTVLAATSVLGDLIDVCPPAKACRDAFEHMSRATIKLCLSTTGFGSEPAAFGAQDRRRSEKVQQAGNGMGPWPPQQESRGLPCQDDMHPLNDGSNARQKNQGMFAGISSLGQSDSARQDQQYDALPDIAASARRSHGVFGRPRTPPTVAIGMDLNQAFHETYNPSVSDELDAYLAGGGGTSYDNQFGTIFGTDNDHAWSDGIQLEMFDGFFFGGMDDGNGRFVRAKHTVSVHVMINLDGIAMR